MPADSSDEESWIDLGKNTPEKTTAVIKGEERSTGMLYCQPWQGMGLFDSATPAMKKRRNQQKDPEVLRRLQATSENVEPIEYVYDTAGTLREKRSIPGFPLPSESVKEGKQESSKPSLPGGEGGTSRLARVVGVVKSMPHRLGPCRSCGKSLTRFIGSMLLVAYICILSGLDLIQKTARNLAEGEATKAGIFLEGWLARPETFYGRNHFLCDGVHLLLWACFNTAFLMASIPNRTILLRELYASSASDMTRRKLFAFALDAVYIVAVWAGCGNRFGLKFALMVYIPIDSISIFWQPLSQGIRAGITKIPGLCKWRSAHQATDVASGYIKHRCKICPKVPAFDTLASMVTHVTSKGHLASHFKLQIHASKGDVASAAIIDEFKEWCRNNSVREMVLNRIARKNRKDQAAAAPVDDCNIRSSTTENDIILQTTEDVTREWEPPLGSWEDHIRRVAAVIEAEDTDANGRLTKYDGLLEWKNGKQTQHNLSVLAQRCPQKVLAYYERSSASASALLKEYEN